MEAHCYQCIHERWIHRQKEDRDEDKCEIISRAMGYDVTDPQYPDEWTYDAKGVPTCTKWVKFDWGTDDDPREPGPKPPPDDPRQLMMPLGMADLFGELWGDEVLSLPGALIEREVLETMRT